MAYALGIALFAFGIFVSVCLHEAGHMVTAKAFGMKVTRYFAGFGPTIWSFRKGETEYGLKAIPLGGFVKIVGMTPLDDDVKPGDEKRAMWRFPVWKRTIVMSAGSITHFMLAGVALWLAAMIIGLPNPALEKPQPAYVSVSDCVFVTVADANANKDCRTGVDPAGPARAAGLRDNDKITAFNGVSVATYDDLVAQIRKAPPGSMATITFQRDGISREARLNLASVQRPPLNKQDGRISTVAALGVGPALPPGTPVTVKYGPIGAIGASAHYTKGLAKGTLSSLQQFPAKIPKLFDALGGKPRDASTPISMVGASRIGGEAVQHSAWEIFVLIFVGLNFFVGVFNLFPLLPLDGGHIAIAWFERVRGWLYGWIGRRDPGRVDYNKLMPLTYAVIFIFGGLTLLTVTADIVNPITIFK